jgi:nitrogen regulatory protein PII
MDSTKNIKTIKKPIQTGLQAPKKLKILVSIIDRRKVDFYISALEGFEVNMQTIFYGMGTAPSSIQAFLGLSNTEKAVILSVVKAERVPEILAAYEDKYFKTKNGKGVAFTIPVKSLIGVQLYQMLANIERGA